MTSSSRGRTSRLSIGRVIDALHDDFPDLTISKIRFLESEGLVSPERTASGYRSFSEEDVERLRFVLSAQRDRFWPLKVIREALDAKDRGLDVPGDASSAPRVPPIAADAAVPTPELLLEPTADLRLTRVEIARAAGLDAATVDALVTYGLLSPGPDGHYDAHALRVAKAAAGLAGFGLEPRHLRPFRTAADREIGLVRQVTATTRGRSDDAGRSAAAEVLAHCIALHTALVKAGL